MKNVRQIVIEALMQVDAQNAWSNLVLDNVFRKYKPDSRDGAFFAALFYGVLERGVTLDACIKAHSKTAFEKLSPVVAEVLRMGVYQLLYMDSVPDHAAVAESVELVRKMGKPQASGFVNGVLRSFLRADKAVPIPEQPLAARLSVEYSCPLKLVELFLREYGEEFTRRVLEGSLGRAPLYIRVNTLLIKKDELISRLEARGIEVTEDGDVEACLMLEKSGAVYELQEFKRGFFHVQDKSSQLCAGALLAEPGDRVLDACAAPGGKTFTIAEAMGGSGEVGGEIVSCDIHEHRVELIRERAKKMGLKSVRAEVRDMTVYDEKLGLFDKILCDVPCSGFGTIRRKPEIKRKNPGDFAELPGIQYKILETASQYLKDGGRLVYSTCTLNPAENERIVEQFLKEHDGFVPARLPDILGGGASRTILGDMDADGFFIAALERKK